MTPFAKEFVQKTMTNQTKWLPNKNCGWQPFVKDLVKKTPTDQQLKV